LSHLPTAVLLTVGTTVGFACGFVFVFGAVFLFKNPPQVTALQFFAKKPSMIVQHGLGGPVVTLPDDDREAPTKQYIIKGSTTFPDISAPTYLVGDVATGQIIASRQRDRVAPIASITKLMTALVADNSFDLDEETVVSRRAIATYGTQGRLSVGDRFTIKEMLYPLLLESSNDAAEVLAEHENHYTFMLDMNAKAKQIGMENTFYDDPSGLSAKNVSTVEDIFRLAQYLYAERPYILDITAMRSFSARRLTWFTNSRFQSYRDYIGGKNGYINASGKTNIAIFSLPIDEEEERRDIAIILFDTRDAEVDTRAVLRYIAQHVYYE